MSVDEPGAEIFVDGTSEGRRRSPIRSSSPPAPTPWKPRRATSAPRKTSRARRAKKEARLTLATPTARGARHAVTSEQPREEATEADPAEAERLHGGREPFFKLGDDAAGRVHPRRCDGALRSRRGRFRDRLVRSVTAMPTTRRSPSTIARTARQPIDAGICVDPESQGERVSPWSQRKKSRSASSSTRTPAPNIRISWTRATRSRPWRSCLGVGSRRRRRGNGGALFHDALRKPADTAAGNARRARAWPWCPGRRRATAASPCSVGSELGSRTGRARRGRCSGGRRRPRRRRSRCRRVRSRISWARSGDARGASVTPRPSSGKRDVTRSQSRRPAPPRRSGRARPKAPHVAGPRVLE